MPHKYHQDITFKTLHRLKGEIPDTLNITPPYFNSSCGADYRSDVGSNFIVFARLEEGKFITHFCDGTRVIPDRESIDTTDSPYDEWKKTLAVRDLQLLNLIDYFKTKKSGKVKFNYANGKSQAKGKFKNGYPVGKWVYYTYTGNLKASGKYLNGKREGEWSEYNYDYDYNKKKYSLYSIDKGEYKNGVKTKTWKSYIYESTDSVVFIEDYKWY